VTGGMSDNFFSSHPTLQADPFVALMSLFLVFPKNKSAGHVSTPGLCSPMLNPLTYCTNR
jgi:hypothetical protein